MRESTQTSADVLANTSRGMLVTISNRLRVNVEAVRGTESISCQDFQRAERMIQECIVE